MLPRSVKVFLNLDDYINLPRRENLRRSQSESSMFCPIRNINISEATKCTTQKTEHVRGASVELHTAFVWYRTRSRKRTKKVELRPKDKPWCEIYRLAHILTVITCSTK